MRAIFRAFGLMLGANRIIPGLTPASAESRVDVQIQLGSSPDGVPEAVANELGSRTTQVADACGRPEAISWHPNSGRGFRLRYDDGTVFIVDERGSRIWATWPSTLTLEDTAVYLLGSGVRVRPALARYYQLARQRIFRRRPCRRARRALGCRQVHDCRGFCRPGFCCAVGRYARARGTAR